MPFDAVVLLLVIAVGVIIVVVLGKSVGVGGCSVLAEIVIIIIPGR